MQEIVPKSGVTIRDVARVAGVSLSSVSRALNGGKNVSARVARDVAAAASTLGYQPDFLARSLRTRSSGMVGCLVRCCRIRPHAGRGRTGYSSPRVEGWSDQGPAPGGVGVMVDRPRPWSDHPLGD